MYAELSYPHRGTVPYHFHHIAAWQEAQRMGNIRKRYVAAMRKGWKGYPNASPT